MTKYPVYEITLNDDVENSGMFGISLVDRPAIEEGFVYFSEEKEASFVFESEEKGLVVGPIMIPNKMILRKNYKTGEYYYVVFTEEVIDDIMYRYSKNGRFNFFTVQHNGEMFDGAVMLEVWKKESDNDKSVDYGYDLPKGTVFAKVKIEDDTLKKSIKDGEINGFSIEINADVKLSNSEKMSEFNFGVELGKIEAKHNATIENLNKQIADLEAHNELMLEAMTSVEERFAGLEDLKKAIEIIQEHIAAMENPASKEGQVEVEVEDDMASDVKEEMGEDKDKESMYEAEESVEEPAAEVEEAVEASEEEAEKALNFEQEGVEEVKEEDKTLVFNAITPEKINLINNLFGGRLY